MDCSVPPFSNFMHHYDAGVRLVTAIPLIHILLAGLFLKFKYFTRSLLNLRASDDLDPSSYSFLLQFFLVLSKARLSPEARLKMC
uniref:Putative ovule protein n=1 Tax=Solanum chacoense TaxID=4108 RepID=A0A0V0GTL2_SOLCH